MVRAFGRASWKEPVTVEIQWGFQPAPPASAGTVAPSRITDTSAPSRRSAAAAWLEQGRKIAVKNAPTYFGTIGYEILSDVDHGKISATVEMPTRNAPKAVRLPVPPSQDRAHQERDRRRQAVARLRQGPRSDRTQRCDGQNCCCGKLLVGLSSGRHIGSYPGRHRCIGMPLGTIWGNQRQRFDPGQQTPPNEDHP